MSRDLVSPYVVTLDMDWAPDWMLEDCLRILVDTGTPATWFVTHDTPVLAEITGRDQFEAAIHPNCLPGSSHGADEREVLEHVLDLVPGATAMRTHGLYQSTSFLALAASMGIERDVSLFLPWVDGLGPHVLPLDTAALCRFPYFWEDDVAAGEPAGPWNIDHPRFHGPGLRIFDFHPVHVCLNTADMAGYERLKAEAPLSEWTRDLVAPHVNAGSGAGTLFRELCAYLGDKGTTVGRLPLQGAPS